jgi:hypothetical protein
MTNNTPMQSTLILKRVGYEESGGMSQGIHWHINNPEGEILYEIIDREHK